MQSRGRRQRQNRVRKDAGRQPFSGVTAFFLTLLLAAGTFALYSSARSHDFINYDDNVYVYENQHLSEGLTWDFLHWAFTTNEAANWHPLTWISHALDYELFQLDPGDHHLTSLVFHCVNAALLFLILLWATKALVRSFFVAALFAWHPFNVQSVAWIAERKNLLSTLFLLLALAAYGWYAQNPQKGRLLLVCLLFAFSLASKPMAVTLPFALLLLDVWPLQRVKGWAKLKQFPGIPQQSIKALLIEKCPLLILSIASCAVTVWAQKTGEAVRSLAQYPFRVRLGNALYSYVVYLWKTFVPLQFAVNYPHPGHSLAWWKPLLAIAILGATTATAWKFRTSHPYILVGWLWFLGTLVPVIGIVQVGDQAMADRYAYVPLIGIFVIVAWGGHALLSFLHVSLVIQRVASALCVLLLCILSAREIGYWQDSVSLWSHALEVTKDNLIAEERLASALTDRGDTDAALPHSMNAVRLDPTDIGGHVNIGTYYGMHGRAPEAIAEFQTVLQLTDHGALNETDRHYRASAKLNLGIAYANSLEFANALASFQDAYHSDPSMTDRILSSLQPKVEATQAEGAYVQLALLLGAKGRREQAIGILQNASREHPDYRSAQQLLAFLR